MSWLTRRDLLLLGGGQYATTEQYGSWTVRTTNENQWIDTLTSHTCKALSQTICWLTEKQTTNWATNWLTDLPIRWLTIIQLTYQPPHQTNDWPSDRTIHDHLARQLTQGPFISTCQQSLYRLPIWKAWKTRFSQGMHKLRRWYDMEYTKYCFWGPDLGPKPQQMSKIWKWHDIWK